jgi:hypothetical protein
MLGENFLDASHEILIVRGENEAVALVGIQHIDHYPPFFSIRATICADSTCLPLTARREQIEHES